MDDCVSEVRLRLGLIALLEVADALDKVVEIDLADTERMELDEVGRSRDDLVFGDSVTPLVRA